MRGSEDAATLSPLEFVDQINKQLPFLSQTELAGLKEYARAWADEFYGEHVPTKVQLAVLQLEGKNAVI
jgi:hypothetical protein